MKRYWPLAALIIVALLGSLALMHGTREDSWMHFFMGLLFTQFALLKLFQPAKFAEGFRMYDWVAKQFPPYAYIYPLIELGLGLAYLSFLHPTLTYLATIVVMGVGAVGVIQALKKGLDVRCACMGTVLDVPLSTVTLSEDIGMGLMAIWMLIGL